MEMTQFAQKIQGALAQILGEEYQVKLETVRKNNGVLLQSVAILAGGRNVSPTIYLEPFWQAYENGAPLSALVDRILQIYRQDTPGEDIDLAFFRNFPRVKERICYRLIHRERNRSLLEEIPHIPFLDLAVCFYYAYQDQILGSGSILISNAHMEMWQTSTAELMALAQENTPKLFAWECLSIARLLKVPYISRELPMQMVSNHQRVHGAACILYPKVLEQLAERFQSNLYIIPSSIHEVLVLPQNCRVDPGFLKETIAEVNSTQVEPEEILSDNLYSFSLKEKHVEII